MELASCHSDPGARYRLQLTPMLCPAEIYAELVSGGFNAEISGLAHNGYI